MDKACQKAIALDEKNAQAYYLAARAARGLKNDLQAIVMLTKAIVQQFTALVAVQCRTEINRRIRETSRHVKGNLCLARLSFLGRSRYL